MLIFFLVLLIIGLAVGLTFFLLKNDHGEKEPVGALWIAVGFGLIGAIAAAYLENKLLPVNDLKQGTNIRSVFGVSMGVGAIEETLKFLPLAFFIYKRRYFNEHTDGIIYFALAGLGFGVPENILYTLQFGSSAGLGRLVLTPIFHAALTAMVGYYLIRIKLYRKSPLIIMPILAFAILLHGLYDFGLSTGIKNYVMLSIVITVTLTINFFRLFFKASDLDSQEGIAAVGHNSFCRSCGSKNPSHHLYCTHCGVRA